MPASFQDRKAKILKDLSIPNDQYNDLSPKGSLDVGIKDLITEINNCADYVTTSSCAGRVAVYLEGHKGVKGGGQWLYSSHDPVAISCDPGAIFNLFGLAATPVSVPDEETVARFVHFKFEPMILHIVTASPLAAQHAASAALSSGFRESGINSILDPAPGHGASPLVAVRSSGLSFDCIIGYAPSSEDESDSNQPTVLPMVSEEYLRILMTIANERFKVNAERRERFRKALLKS